jgi:hypothetical protein
VSTEQLIEQLRGECYAKGYADAKSHCEAERDKLRELVKDAYFEGCRDSTPVSRDEYTWINSESCFSLGDKP